MIALLAVWIGISLLIGYLGRDRKFGFWGYFAISLLFSWVVGLICVFASDKRSTANQSAPTPIP